MMYRWNNLEIKSDDIHRSEIAQAIMIFSEEILDRVDIMDSDNV